MLQAIILVCDLYVMSMADCNRTNARDVVIVPERVSVPTMCAVVAQQYIARTEIGRGDTSYRERIKIVCERR
jgi:hypothetical protein